MGSTKGLCCALSRAQGGGVVIPFMEPGLGATRRGEVWFESQCRQME